MIFVDAPAAVVPDELEVPVLRQIDSGAQADDRNLAAQIAACLGAEDLDEPPRFVRRSVDVARATWTNTIGAPELITVSQDPEFDPNHRAFYYARVIEIPTPRWSAYDAVRYDTEMREDVVMTTTERAYTSPIWYTP